MARSVALWAGLACLVAACCAPLAAADRWANPPLTPTCDKQMDGILDQFYGDNSTLAGCDDDCRKQCNEVLHFTFTIMDRQRCFTEDRIRECLVVRPRSCSCTLPCSTGYRCDTLGFVTLSAACETLSGQTTAVLVPQFASDAWTDFVRDCQTFQGSEIVRAHLDL